MKYIDDINLFKSNKDFVAEIDMTGSLGRIYHYPQRMEGCLFLLCLRGECDITIHLSEHKIQKNDIVTILPETFVHVHRQSPDCRLYLIGFNKELLNGINLFNSTMNYLSALIDTPIIPLRPEITELFQDYFRLLIKMKRMGAKPNKELISTMLLTILHGVGSIPSEHQCNHTYFQPWRRNCETPGPIYHQTLYERTECSFLCRPASYIPSAPQHYCQ